MAARSLTLTSTPHHPAHSGSRSTIAGRIASQAATTSPDGHREAAAGPPPDVGLPRPGGPEAHAAERGPVGVAGEQDDRAGIVVGVVEVGSPRLSAAAAEEALLLHEHGAAQGPVGD